MEENPYETPKCQHREPSRRYCDRLLRGLGGLSWGIDTIQGTFFTAVILLCVLGTLVYNARLLFDWLF
jgi:hypothetical protein